MSPVLTGATSFLLFVWFDARKLRQKRGGAVFALGSLLLGLSAAALLLRSGAAFPEGRGTLRLFAGAMALVFLALLLYVLFFALPRKTYAAGGETPLSRQGVYGRCRHPGFWPFLAAALCAGAYGGTAEVWAGMALFTALDLVYILLQDAYFFPRYIPGYDVYRRDTPFLFPRLRRS